jgi:hypothetical protein
VITAKIVVDTQVFTAIRTTAQKSPGLMTTAFNRTVGRINAQFRAEMKSQEPGPAKYPIQWASVRQRRYVMAKLRREGNLPYQRTGELLDSWRVTHDGADGEGVIIFENTADAAQFVFGENQQRMHVNTGWQRAEPTIERYVETTQDTIFQTWQTVADPTAGVR